MPHSEAQEDESAAWSNDHAVPRDAAVELADLPYQRLTQRHSPPPDRRNLWLLFAAVVLAHLLVAWVAYLVLRPSFQRRELGGVFSVTLIEPAQDLPPPPLLAPPPIPGAPQPPRVHYEAPARNATKATLEGSKAPPLRLFGANGEIRLAPQASARPAPAYSAAGLQSSHIYDGKPLPYKATPFNKAWAPDHETLGHKTVGRAFEKAAEATTVKKTVRVGGVRIHCAVSPLLLFAGCKPDDPQPPPKNDNDIRLSLPPAQTLTGKKVVLPKSASSTGSPSSP